MKTKKNFAELLGLTAFSVSGISMVVAIVLSVINLLFYKGTNQPLDSISVIGCLAFMMPFFMFQFLMPAGLLDRFGTEIPFWGKLTFYLVVFPFANIWMLAAADAAFHFLPNFHEAMAQGASRLIVQAMREQATSQAWAIIGITYVSMISAGLLFRGIFGKKKAKIA